MVGYTVTMGKKDKEPINIYYTQEHNETEKTDICLDIAKKLK